MSKDFMCQADDGNSGQLVSLRSSIEPRGEAENWFALTGDERLGRCATENCYGGPTWRLEADGVGSNYCSGCRAKILATPTQTQLEEPGTGDEVDAAGASASLTPHEAKAREITAPYDSCLLIGSDMRDLIGAISSALLTVQKQERERCAKMLCEHCRAGVPAIWINTDALGHETTDGTLFFCDAAAIRQGDDNAS